MTSGVDGMWNPYVNNFELRYRIPTQQKALANYSSIMFKHMFHGKYESRNCAEQIFDKRSTNDSQSCQPFAGTRKHFFGTQLTSNFRKEQQPHFDNFLGTRS